MKEYRVSWFSIFGVAFVAALGINTSSLVWNKIIEPKISK